MNINDEYQLYCSTPTDENLARLFNAAREYAFKIGQELFPDLYQRHACESAAATVLLDFEEKFDPQKGSFSTWAYQSIRADLIDWRRGKRWHLLQDSLDDHRELQLPEETTLDEKLLLKKILSTLSKDERALCQMKAYGEPLDSIASTLGISLATVKRRWKTILEKCRGIEVR
jgi:RNA polymerase sigma factor (sigma-70 family)